MVGDGKNDVQEVLKKYLDKRKLLSAFFSKTFFE